MRDAIAKVQVAAIHKHSNLDGVRITDCPFTDELGLNAIRDAAKTAGLAYENIHP